MNRKSVLFKSLAGLGGLFGLSTYVKANSTADLIGRFSAIDDSAKAATQSLTKSIEAAQSSVSSSAPDGFALNGTRLTPGRFGAVGMDNFYHGDWIVLDTNRQIPGDGEYALLALDEATGELLMRHKKTKEYSILQGDFSLHWMRTDHSGNLSNETKNIPLQNVVSPKMKAYISQTTQLI